ncbi:hypothetical protein [Pedobacter aquatilis]|uniref:hypothetical protein n=1 Tax=Pedobacter aquatilis TaxID=351343 RepID=UPI002931E356|nr:hypothetical protein [Pedobacter aquatilis]
MKTTNILLAGLSLCFAACQSPANTENKQDTTVHAESVAEKAIETDFLIVPGRSIGQVALGEDMITVGEKLGKPDAGDAAMGKAWGIWYGKDSSSNTRNELAVYSAYRDTSMRVKEVKQIRITANQFKTKDGIGVGISEADAKLNFKAMELAATYINEKKDTINVFDAKKDGIGFEFLKGKSISLTVHPVNQSINNTYLTLHPEWKKI